MRAVRFRKQSDMRKFSKKIDPGFPAFGDKLKAEDYWRSIGRHDLQRMTDQIVAEFRAHHERKGTMSPSWPAVWKTWYVRAVRFIEPPKFREGARSRRDPYRAPTETETTVPLSMVREFAQQLAEKAKR